MATALARGWGEPVLVADVDHGRAQMLAEQLGGEAPGSNAYVADQADAVVLCHKPGQLGEVAGDIRDRAKAVISILGGTPLSAVEAAYPGLPVYRFMPNIPAEVGHGVFCYAPGTLASEGPEQDVLDMFGRIGTVVKLPEPLIDPATALMGCGPAFFALAVESLVDAGVRHGLTADDAGRLAVETMAGTADVLREYGNDTAGLRRRVTSPGGSTARGLDALERGGLRAAFSDAVDAVVQVGR
ncbi:MAG: pyrroline-5-carboxylate reductase [Thermoleophilaceae bacterium]|nr:pyrroline-5-carboxylate reductase [Thermoleophilaceae bacterium]